MLDVYHRRLTIYLAILLLLLPSCTDVTQSSPTDKLAYIVNNSNATPLMLYDPIGQSSRLLRSDIKNTF